MYGSKMVVIFAHEREKDFRMGDLLRHLIIFVGEKAFDIIGLDFF